MQLRPRDHAIKWIASVVIKTLWLTCKVRIHNEDKLSDILESKQAVIPCYWHQQHLFGLHYLLRLKQKFGKNIGVLASPSRDGEIPSRIIQKWGLKVIRGSSSKTGAQALRDLCRSVLDENISPGITPDGPRGPIYEAKPGALMLAQHTGSPIVPIKIAASRYWHLRSWDKFMIPKPFSRIDIHIGETIFIDRKLPLSELSNQQEKLTKALNKL